VRDRAGAVVENGRRRREKRVEAIGAAKGIGISLEFLVSSGELNLKSGGDRKWEQTRQGDVGKTGIVVAVESQR
jgi:hypothetical protein